MRLYQSHKGIKIVKETQKEAKRRKVNRMIKGKQERFIT